MKKWILWMALWGAVSTQAAGLRIPDALEIRELTARQDNQVLEDFLQRYQREYESDPTAERPLLQAYWALGANTDIALASFYDRWVTERPQSYEARVSRAHYFWGRAVLIAHPKASSEGVQSDSAWRQHYRFLEKAKADLEAALALSRHPLAAQRSLMMLCKRWMDEACALRIYRKAIVQAPMSLALRRGYLSTTDDPKIWTQEISKAEKLGLSKHAMQVLKAEQQLNATSKIRQADGGTEVAIFRSLVKSVQDPWLDERAGHMFMRRNNYTEAIPLYTRALDAHPNLTDALYWRGQAYYAKGDLLAGHADTMRAAMMGNPQASRSLIDSYVSGEKGLPKDLAAAASWCVLGAQNDQSYGAFCLGDIYANGYAGYPRDLKKSQLWIQRAAELGHQTAQHDLGVILLKGLNGQPVDRKTGIHWLKLSAQGGFEYADKKLRMHLSRWEYFQEVTWPAYRDTFAGGNFDLRLAIGLIMEMVRIWIS